MLGQPGFQITRSPTFALTWREGSQVSPCQPADYDVDDHSQEEARSRVSRASLPPAGRCVCWRGRAWWGGRRAAGQDHFAPSSSSAKMPQVASSSCGPACRRVGINNRTPNVCAWGVTITNFEQLTSSAVWQSCKIAFPSETHASEWGPGVEMGKKTE